MGTENAPRPPCQTEFQGPGPPLEPQARSVWIGDLASSFTVPVPPFSRPVPQTAHPVQPRGGGWCTRLRDLAARLGAARTKCRTRVAPGRGGRRRGRTTYLVLQALRVEGREDEERRGPRRPQGAAESRGAAGKGAPGTPGERMAAVRRISRPFLPASPSGKKGSDREQGGALHDTGPEGPRISSCSSTEGQEWKGVAEWRRLPPPVGGVRLLPDPWQIAKAPPDWTRADRSGRDDVPTAPQPSLPSPRPPGPPPSGKRTHAAPPRPPRT
jgi:hypothetical protein